MKQLTGYNFTTPSDNQQQANLTTVGIFQKASYIAIIINQQTGLFERIEYIKRLSGVVCQVCVYD